MNIGKKIAYLQLHRICDQDCIFCAQPTNGNYMNFDEIKEQIDFYIKNGYTGIIFSGGEPTLSPYIFQAVNYCLLNGLEMSILTNGHKLEDEEFTKNIINIGLKNFHISLHSHIEKIHDLIVKKNGSYKRSISAMLNILKYGGILNINVTINNYNVDYFPKMILYLIKLFPNINTFIINNLELSQIKPTYYNVIAPLLKVKKIIIPTLDILKKYSKKARVERVPMCYLRGYEEYSVDIEYSLFGEKKFLHYLDSNTQSGELNYSTYSADYTYGKPCLSCDLKDICSGLDGLGKHYNEIDLISQKLTEYEKSKLIKKLKNSIF